VELAVVREELAATPAPQAAELEAKAVLAAQREEAAVERAAAVLAAQPVAAVLAAAPAARSPK
jgi:hypothetical protein